MCLWVMYSVAVSAVLFLFVATSLRVVSGVITAVSWMAAMVQIQIAKISLVKMRSRLTSFSLLVLDEEVIRCSISM
jgi:hypothetical protein